MTRDAYTAATADLSPTARAAADAYVTALEQEVERLNATLTDDPLRLRAQHCAGHDVHTVAATAHYILTGDHKPSDRIEDEELRQLRLEVRKLREAGP